MTFNEEKNILNCLNSVKNVFDEIIVLDSFSSDNTINIIKSNFKDVKILFHKWIDDFSYHRNLIINNASSDWIYFIDSDNYYDPSNLDNAHRIAKFLSFFKLIVTTSPIIFEHDKSYSVDTRRFFPLKQNIFFKGKIHEEPFCGNKILEDLPVNLKVFHHGYDPNIVNLKLKAKRNIKLTKEMCTLEPNNAKWFYFYAQDLFNLDNFNNLDEIKSYLQKALNLYSIDNSYTRYHKETISLLCKICMFNNNSSELEIYTNSLEKLADDCIDVLYYRSLLIINKLNQKRNILINEIEKAIYNKKNFCSFINPNFDHINFLLFSIYFENNNFEKMKNLLNKNISNMCKNDMLNMINNKFYNMDTLLKQFYQKMDNTL